MLMLMQNLGRTTQSIMVFFEKGYIAHLLAITAALHWSLQVRVLLTPYIKSQE